MKKQTIVLLPLATLLLFLNSCALSSGNRQESPSASKATDSSDNLENFRVSEVSGPQEDIPRVEELEKIPVEINPSVNKWIGYFQNRGRVHMERYLLRSTRYEALMKKVLRDNRLPEDLFYIALIESGFSSHAFSHASAVGYWQFIRGTGKRYNLKINRMVDERRDPVLSTQAAADYYKDLFKRFNSWYLAMAAYNVGEGRVERAVKKYKTRDFWALAKIPRALPRETDDYVPKYIAAKLIAKNPDQYGFEGIDYMPPIEFDHVNFDQPVNLRLMAEKMNINYEDFKALNPKFKGEVAPLDDDRSLGLRIPPGTYEVALLAAKESAVDTVEFVADQQELQAYRIRKGDTLSSIARRYRTTVAYLRDINDFTRRKKLKIGQRMFVPDRTPLKEKRPELVASAKKKRYHVVKKGENLGSIARKYGVTVAALRKVNKLKSKSVIRYGSRLYLPEENKKL